MTDWYKIKRVLIWQGWVEKQIYPATWNPGSNTIAYYTFDEQNLNDSSWNNNNASWYNWAWSYVSVGWWYCANLWWSHAIDLPFTVAWLTNWTMNIWMNVQWTKTISWILGTRTWQTGTFHMNYIYNFSWRTWINITVNPESDIDWSWVLTTWNWYNIVATKSWTTYSIYINSSLWASWTRWEFTDTNTLCLGTTYDNTRCFNWYLDSAIFENKAWSADEITAYYNLTKSKYGL